MDVLKCPGILAKTTLPIGTTEYTYDGRNRVTYIYDGAGRIKKSNREAISNGLYYYNTYYYDKAGNRSRVKQEENWGYPIYSTESDISLYSDGHYYLCKEVNYVYDKANRLTLVSEYTTEDSESFEGVRENNSIRYIFDDAGNEISHTTEYLTPGNDSAAESISATSGGEYGHYDSTVEVSVNEYNGLG